MKYIILSILLIPLLSGGLIFAQTTQAEIETFLVQEWIHSPVSASVDQHASGKCDSGKSYVFAPEGKLEIHECRQQRMRTTHTSWSTNQSEYGDWLLTLGEEIYLIEMNKKSGKDVLTLIKEATEESPETTSVVLYRLVEVVSGNEEAMEEPE